MKYRHIGLGTKIELEIQDENGEGIRPVLVSQYEMYDEAGNMMDIHAPFYEGRIISVHPKTVMNVIFSKEKDSFTFEAEALQMREQGNIIYLQIKPLTPIKKIQRRSFFRMECELKVRYRVFESLLPDDKLEGPFLYSKTRDISGGGLCVITDKKLEKGLYMEVYMELSKEVRFVGQIVRSKGIREKGKQLYETGVELIRIGNGDRERIINYIFEVQRNRLKKGWQKI